MHGAPTEVHKLANCSYIINKQFQFNCNYVWDRNRVKKKGVEEHFGHRT